MAIRYYPSFRIKPNLNTRGEEFLLNGSLYSGKYYQTYDGKYFTGPNNILGPNEPLVPIERYLTAPGLDLTRLPESVKRAYAKLTKAKGTRSLSLTSLESNRALSISTADGTEPISYQPKPLDSDYNRGYFNRYFVKKINETGYIKEISVEEYSKINDGSVTYDVSFYQTEKILWKLTGPLNTVRLSQYDIRAGVVDTNKRLIEATDARFLGLKTYIGEEYAKFARATQ